MEATIKSMHCHFFLTDGCSGDLHMAVRFQVKIKVGKRVFTSSTRERRLLRECERKETPKEEGAIIGKWAMQAMRDRYLYMQKTLGESLPPMPEYKQWRKESNLYEDAIDNAVDEWFARSQNYIEIGKI